jgi:hypothetical protein
MRGLPGGADRCVFWQRAQSRHGRHQRSPATGSCDTASPASARYGARRKPAGLVVPPSRRPPHPRRARAGRGMRPWPGADAGGPAAAGRWERTCGAAAARAAIAAPLRSAARRPRACGTGWSLPTRTRVTSRLRPGRSTWWSAAWRSATSGKPAGGHRRCARRCGSCGPAAGRASPMTARTATPLCCGTPASPTWLSGSWTGGPGTAYRVITCPWSQPARPPG